MRTIESLSGLNKHETEELRIVAKVMGCIIVNYNGVNLAAIRLAGGSTHMVKIQENHLEIPHNLAPETKDQMKSAAIMAWRQCQGNPRPVRHPKEALALLGGIGRNDQGGNMVRRELL
jgi:hypothetical protein